MKTTRKTSAPLAPGGPLTGGRDDGVAAAPWWRPLPQPTAPADLAMRPCATPATATTSAPSTAPAAARAKARASERTPAAAPQRQQPPAPPAPPATTRPAGAPPAAQQTRPRSWTPPSADPPHPAGLVGHPPAYWRLKAASQKNHRGRREPVC